MKLLGDLVHDTLEAFGFKACADCERRRKKLNAADAKLRAKVRRKPCAECQKAKKIG